MSGHSKWHNIRIKKQKMDKQRGKLFTKVSREIYVAVKEGGPNPDTNMRLKLAISKAKDINMPKDNIKRVIEKASGSGKGENYEQLLYEAYGPGGIAILMEILTDNKNRAAAYVRQVLNKYGGTLAEAGAVSWNFERKGVITFEKGSITEDELFEVAIEAGAEDVKTNDDGSLEIITSVKDFSNVKDAIEKNNIKYESAEIVRLPKTTVKPSIQDAKQALTLLEKLEELDDVSNVYTNLEIDEEAIV